MRVDPDAVLAVAVAAQGFQTVGRQGRKVPECLGVVEQGQAAHSLIGEPVEGRHPVFLEAASRLSAILTSR